MGFSWLFLTELWTVLLAGVFYFAALHKLWSPAGTQRAIGWYATRLGMDDTPAESVAAIGFPALVILEVSLATVLLIGRVPRVAMAASVLVFGGFTAWLAHARLLGMQTGCGCGLPPLFGEGVGGAVLRNAVLMCLTVLAFAGRRPAANTRVNQKQCGERKR
ncbi:MAG: hypothetical protein IT431_10560 [Phycisphaerales bacterium]|nr:hypothetical protein [Phycisphaerales bacterium]